MVLKFKFTAQPCKRFATASISTQVAVLPWRYNARWAPKTRYTLRRNYGEYNERFGFDF